PGPSRQVAHLVGLQSPSLRHDKSISPSPAHGCSSGSHSFLLSRRQYLAAKINFKSIRHRFEPFGRRAIAALELAQGLNINLANHAIVGHTALDPQYITLPTVFGWCADAAITVLAVIALNNVSVHIQRGRLHQGIEGFSVLIPLRHKQ